MTHKEILKNHNLLKTTQEIDLISNENIERWIKENMFRIEFVIEFNEKPLELNLLEALAQFYLNPIFEGRKVNLPKQ